MKQQDNNRLQELRHSDYDIVDEQPDIQGWSIYDGQHRRIGKVHDLLFDPQAQKVRYIIANLKDNEFNIQSDQVLIPIGIAELHKSDDEVSVSSLSEEQLRNLPPYTRGEFSDSDENKIGTLFAAGSVAGAAGTDIYDREYFRDDNLYRNRNTTEQVLDQEVIPVVHEQLNVDKTQVQTGGIRIRSKIVELPVEQNVQLREESLRVDRTPVDREASTQSFRETELQAASYAEVPVVSKEARVVEEIRLNKDVTERDETIQDSVRQTEVDIENVKGNSNRSSDDSFRK